MLADIQNGRKETAEASLKREHELACVEVRELRTKLGKIRPAVRALAIGKGREVELAVLYTSLEHIVLLRGDKPPNLDELR